MQPVEIKASITFKDKTTPEQADKIIKKMIKSLELDELLLIEETRLHQIIAEINVQGDRDGLDEA